MANRLAKVQADLKKQGLGLKVFDCYRPFAIQQKFWSLVPNEDWVAKPVAKDGKPVIGSKHNRGAAVDLTLVDASGKDIPMDGVELTRKIRRQHRKDTLAVIGISAYGNSILSARFIKNGANDYLNKPFSSEEFYCRVTQNLEMLEYIQKLRETSIRDPLTGLYNRRHFFETAPDFHVRLAKGEGALTLAM